jgi:hypothetical protein
MEKLEHVMRVYAKCPKGECCAATNVSDECFANVFDDFSYSRSD